MMYEREVRIHPEWLGGAEKEKKLLKRLHQIISGVHGDRPRRKSRGYKWQIDASNDWWAEIRDGKLIIASRYSNSKLDVLARFCRQWFS